MDGVRSRLCIVSRGGDEWSLVLPASEPLEDARKAREADSEPDRCERGDCADGKRAPLQVPVALLRGCDPEQQELAVSMVGDGDHGTWSGVLWGGLSRGEGGGVTSGSGTEVVGRAGRLGASGALGAVTVGTSTCGGEGRPGGCWWVTTEGSGSATSGSALCTCGGNTLAVPGTVDGSACGLVVMGGAGVSVAAEAPAGTSGATASSGLEPGCEGADDGADAALA
jgi:hypothetical protein